MTQAVRFTPVDVDAAQQMSAAEAIEYHYDNDTAFFSLWLDETLSYSCARWAAPFGGERQPDLAAAQAAKIAYHLNAAKVPEGGRLIDIGCGWGGLLEAVVKNDPSARAVGLTLSKDQHEHIGKRATPGVTAELRDVFAYESETPFDAAVSIGAFEHFARPQMDREQKIAVYRAFFDKLAGLLVPGARFSLQTIVWDNVDFTTAKKLLPETVFPQSDLPFISEIVEASADRFRLVYLENDPDEYADTLTAWISGLRAVKSQVLADGGREKYDFFYNYLRRSRLSFKQRVTSLSRMVLVRHDERAYP